MMTAEKLANILYEGEATFLHMYESSEITVDIVTSWIDGTIDMVQSGDCIDFELQDLFIMRDNIPAIVKEIKSWDAVHESDEVENFSDCRFCNFEMYRGDFFSTVKHIDGSDQNLEVCIFNSPEDEQYVIEIDGTFIDIRIPIKFCPNCGRKL